MPADGQGLNPQLQNYWMVMHPIALYLGFVGMTVPFAFAVAALVTGQLGNGWIKLIRRWTLVPWAFLTIGILLGSQWAYIELGWGGYWAWDPVENASFLPWLTATAFVHSIMIQERRGMLKVWNMVLIGLTWELTLIGTFLTRSGVVQSVHSFALSPVGPMFAGLHRPDCARLYGPAGVALAEAEEREHARLRAVARDQLPDAERRLRAHHGRDLPRHDLPVHLRAGDRRQDFAERALLHARRTARSSSCSCS